MITFVSLGCLPKLILASFVTGNCGDDTLRALSPIPVCNFSGSPVAAKDPLAIVGGELSADFAAKFD